jgi:hypothetical protein
MYIKLAAICKGFLPHKPKKKPAKIKRERAK